MRRGFTLIELMIVTAVFSVIFLVATTVWSNSFRQHQQIQLSQRVTSDERTLIETIARTVRTGTVNYTRYEWGELGIPFCNQLIAGGSCSLSGAVPILSIIPSDGSGEVCYRRNPSTGTLQVSTGNCFYIVSSATNISPPDVVVDDFHVFISPRSNPFADPSTSPITDPNHHVSCNFIHTNPVTYHNSDCDAKPLTMDRWCCDPSDLPNCHPENQGPGVPDSTTPPTCVTANVQPTVTIFLTTHSASGTQKSTSTLQTTVVTRTYQR